MHFVSKFNSIIRFPILYRKKRGKPCDKGISRFNNRKVHDKEVAGYSFK